MHLSVHPNQSGGQAPADSGPAQHDAHGRPPPDRARPGPRTGAFHWQLVPAGPVPPGHGAVAFGARGSFRVTAARFQVGAPVRAWHLPGGAGWAFSTSASSGSTNRRGSCDIGRRLALTGRLAAPSSCGSLHLGFGRPDLSTSPRPEGRRGRGPHWPGQALVIARGAVEARSRGRFELKFARAWD